MRRVLAVLLGVILGGGMTFAASQYHVVRTPSGVLLVARKEVAWSDVYADIRGWTPSEWREHRALGQDLVAAGHGEFVAQSGAERLIQDLFEGFRKREPPGRASARPQPDE